ncbi:Uu.00g119870.m01.CDS01 [Anthostomella pinea]|uniref:Uu.00g119870.m01.CDS01 n=1 Tax=Anthostomella pinea TaxID=933095 RepID=A0AAI8VGR0_9PEZI|nr:Uu.00g119870.m01.CDS01 [Anthostomella pinea]
MGVPSSPRARRAIKIVIVILIVALLIHVLLRLVDFSNLFGFFRDHSGIKISQREILDAYTSRKDQGTTTSSPVIPRILHQVYHDWSDPESTNTTLPDDWAAARQTCIALNPGWEYKLWSSKGSRDFIQDEFPWFLSTYDGYKFPVQRVDVIRYFALRRFGGVYIDLDNGCAESLDAITYFPAFTTDGGHGTLSNNIIGGQPGHPFFHLLTESLIPWNWNWILPYVIVSYTSGQWFLTAVWEQYHRLLSAEGVVQGMEGTGWAPLHHILMDTRPDQPDPFVFWTQERGGTWDQWDSAWFGWVGNHIGLVVSEVIGAIAFVAILLWGCVWCCCYLRRRKAKGYKRIDALDPVGQDMT